MRNFIFCCVVVLFSLNSDAQRSLQKLYPVSYSKVEINDAFWTPRMKTVANATLDACVNYTENKTGRSGTSKKLQVEKEGSMKEFITTIRMCTKQ